VSFYTVRPGGLDTGSSLMMQGTSNLAVLAEQTDGLSVLATNDLRGGMVKIADDLSVSSSVVAGAPVMVRKTSSRVGFCTLISARAMR